MGQLSGGWGIAVAAVIAGITVGTLRYVGRRAFAFKDVRERKIHLRQVLRLAVSLEERGYHLYRHLAETAAGESSRAIWHRLSQDELHHRRVVRQMMRRWRSLPLDTATRDWYEHRLQAQGIFTQHPDPSAGQETIVRYAIMQEERMTGFYAAFEKLFPAAWKRVEIQMLVMAERSHATLLRESFRDHAERAAPEEDAH